MLSNLNLLCYGDYMLRELAEYICLLNMLLSLMIKFVVHLSTDGLLNPLVHWMQEKVCWKMILRKRKRRMRMIKMV